MLSAAANEVILIDWESLAKFLNTTANAFLHGFVLWISKHFADPIRDYPHLFFLHSASRQCGRADSKSRWLQRRLSVEWNRVLINCYRRALETLLCLRAGQSAREDIDQHKMVVSSARDDSEPVTRESFGQR